MQTLDNYKQYECIGILKENENKRVRVYKNNQLDRMIVERILKGNHMEVYGVLNNVCHPNLLEIYDAVFEKEETYIIEEFFDGIMLSEILKDRKMTRKEAKHISVSVCNALEALHANNIIHRDIKPQNVMIDDKENVKLIDYDISKIYRVQRDDDTQMLGTLGFAAPEQYGISQSNERTDVFALGVMLNMMLTGEHPSVKLCDGRFRSVVKKCVLTENAGRYKNVLELKKALLLC